MGENREAQAQSGGFDTEAAKARYIQDCSRGEHLLFSGQAAEAAAAFAGVLATLADRPCYDRAVVLGRLGYCTHLMGQSELAAVRLREAVDIATLLPNSDAVNRLRGVLHAELGEVLSASGQQMEARGNYEAALRLAHEAAARQLSETSGPESWARFGTLADMLEREAHGITDTQRAEALRNRAFAFRQIQTHGHQFVAALAEREAPSIARALLLGRLGRCFQMAGRPDLAVGRLREAVATAHASPGDDDPTLLRMLHVDLATALCGINGLAEAKQSLAAALRISQSRRDLRGQAIDQIHLGALSVAKGEHDEALTRYRAAQELVCDVGDAALAAPVSEALKHLSSAPVPEESAPRSGDEIMVREDWTTEYGIEPDLLIDGPPELRIERWAGAQPPLAAYVCPELQPCTRIYMDERDGIHFALPGGEPVVERLAGCTVMRRKWSEVVVTMTPRLVWRVVQMMDGKTKVACILAELPEDDRTTVARLLAGLQAAGAIDISGRAVASFIHAATKKGTLPAGGLDSDEVMTLATDGNYRVYPEAARVPLTASIPEELESFHALTRKRRSQRDYLGLAVSRDELEAVLATACGVTGERNWAGRKTSLRAYPSSGGLYAVEIYPVALRVEGLDPAVFHFRPIENVLELVKPADPHAFIAAMLPMERALVANAAVLICLAANFPRHERKYGQGGYRMLIAEAGHISQNLILAATALGLAARPFGGVFDGLLNSELGLQAPDEEFLLSVVLGRAAVGDP